ncbi:MAG: DUF418 domain-containing protein [Erythrobacter sp.]
MVELDVLRGFALFAVFIVHFTSAAFYNLPVSIELLERAAESSLDNAALFITEVMFYDKGNTLFATLFGMGFWIMLERLEARSTAFETIYFRRLLILLLIGLINAFLIFPGDVLHEYAVIGLVLMTLRWMGPRALLFVGLALALAGRAIAEILIPGAIAAWDQFEIVQADAFADGGYWNWVRTAGAAHVERDIIQGTAAGWVLYALGRFMLGAWIIRIGWIQRSRELLPAFRKWAIVLLPIGFAAELTVGLFNFGIIELPIALSTHLHSIGTLLLAAGFALGLIVALHSKARAIAELFAPLGQIALTAYVAHGAIFTLIFFPFGLDLLNTIGPAQSLAIAVTMFSGMTLLAHAWLKRFTYGPLEYLWRWATYGSRPAFKRAAV